MSQPVLARPLSSSDDDDDDDDDNDVEVKALPKCLEESCFLVEDDEDNNNDDDDAAMTQNTKATKEETLRLGIRDVLTKDKKLHQRVLFYRPVDFEEFHLKVRSSGLRCNKQFTMNWLDDMGIQFTMKNTKQGEKRKEKSKRRQERFKKKKNALKAK